MTNEQIKALDTLIAAVESGGNAIQHNIYVKAAHAFTPEDAYGKCTFHDVAQAFYGSLDASKALHEALLPGWGWTVSADGSSVYGDDPKVYDGDDARSPARAWLIAILKAYRAKMVA